MLNLLLRLQQKPPGSSAENSCKADTTIKQNEEPPANEKYFCGDLLKKLVFSSNLEALKKFRETSIRTENISEDKITIAVYAKEMSDRTGELRAVENTVA